jgi:hypothetical protein
MARKYRFRKDPDSFESKSMPAESSVIAPLPYFPNLRRALASHGAALLLIYLELHFPAPQDSPDRPVRLETARVMLDLQLGLRLFQRYRTFISTSFTSETARIGAARAGREFYRPDQRVSGSLKPYSVTTAGPGTLSLRRNYPRLRSLLDAAGVSQGEIRRFTEQIAQRKRDEREPDLVLSAQFEEPLEVIAGRSAESAALSVARKLADISGLGDGRRKRDLVRAPHNRRPWTEERRQKVADAWARRRAEVEADKSDGFEP